jgi:transposase InsO family protein
VRHRSIGARFRALTRVGFLTDYASDNGSEFINAHLLGYCRAHAVQFTPGRPYKKDDNAHIEQKNWTHVRKLMGLRAL